jgi:hypothetical protein
MLHKAEAAVAVRFLGHCRAGLPKVGILTLEQPFFVWRTRLSVHF